VKYPQDKYRSANYQYIGRILYGYAEDGLGDAHFKNWRVIYPDTVTPILSPAYDVVTTRVYMGDERAFSLSLGKGKGKGKAWYEASMEQFEYWVGKGGIPWRAIRPHLLDTVEKARSLWPEALKDLPMDDEHKAGLAEHWQNLNPDFSI
jgi:serine/threonine-protein kinase HipA